MQTYTSLSDLVAYGPGTTMDYGAMIQICCNYCQCWERISGKWHMVAGRVTLYKGSWLSPVFSGYDYRWCRD